MGKKELRRQLLEEIQSVSCFQLCPNTFAEVVVRHDGTTHRALGFAKVQWPDRWDSDYGIKMAVRKQIARIARAILRGEVVYDEIEGLSHRTVDRLFEEQE